MILGKSTVIACILILFLSTPVIVNAEEPLATVNQYLEALKNGQTEILIATLGGKLNDKRIGLLKKNKGYPEFLKKYYRDAEFSVLKIRPYDKNVPTRKQLVEIEVRFNKNNTGRITLIVERDESDVWKIVDEVEG